MAAKVGNSISRTVDTNMDKTITNADQAASLEKAFDDEFGALNEIGGAPAPKPAPPDKPETPPAKPEPPIKAATPPEKSETPPVKTEPPEAKPEVSPKEKAETPPPDPAKPAPHPDDEEDEELDAIQLHPDSRPETVTAFRQARGAAKTAKKDAKALRGTVEELRKQNESLKATVRPVSDPTVQAELDNLRKFQQTHQIFDDSTYQVQYEQPVRSMFDDIIKDVISLASDQEAATEWEKSIRLAGPDKLDRQWWLEGVINQCSDPLHKDRLVRKISSLLEAQGKRDQFRQQMASQPDAYEKFRHDTAAEWWKTFSVEAEDEALKIIPTLGDWATEKDLAMAKTDAERTSWEAHNKTYKEYENLFQTMITDAATKGPRGMTRVAAAATKGEYYKRELDATTIKLKKMESELKQAQDELNKISNARSKVTQGSNGTANGPGSVKSKPRLGESVADAFKREFKD